MTQRPVELWTIGYEKSGLADFIRTLAGAGVTLVCDVRDLPQSRRAGFSKRQFAASLAEAGIDYRHLKALGTPKEGRVAHRAHDLASFWAIYERQLGSPAAQAALIELGELVTRQATCLVCFEAEAAMCHRARIVTELATRLPIHANHLTVEPLFL